MRLLFIASVALLSLVWLFSSGWSNYLEYSWIKKMTSNMNNMNNTKSTKIMKIGLYDLLISTLKAPFSGSNAHSNKSAAFYDISSFLFPLRSYVSSSVLHISSFYYWVWIVCFIIRYFTFLAFLSAGLMEKQNSRGWTISSGKFRDRKSFSEMGFSSFFLYIKYTDANKIMKSNASLNLKRRLVK